VLFAITWSLQRPGYIQGTVKTSAWIVAIAAELVLAVGGSWEERSSSSLRPQGHDANDRPTNVKDALTPTLTTENRTPGEMAARIP
jgi:hypothetical protein